MSAKGAIPQAEAAPCVYVLDPMPFETNVLVHASTRVCSAPWRKICVQDYLELCKISTDPSYTARIVTRTAKGMATGCGLVTLYKERHGAEGEIVPPRYYPGPEAPKGPVSDQASTRSVQRDDIESVSAKFRRFDPFNASWVKLSPERTRRWPTSPPRPRSTVCKSRSRSSSMDHRETFSKDEALIGTFTGRKSSESLDCLGDNT